MPEGGARNAPHGVTVKSANIIKPSPTPAQAPLQEGRSRCRGPGAAGLFGLAENPCSARKIPCAFPARGKKFPASPLREFCRKGLKSNAFSGRIFPQKAEFPANSLCAGNFSPYPASKSAKGALTQVNDVPTVPFKLIENFEGASRCGRRRRQGRRV